MLQKPPGNAAMERPASELPSAPIQPDRQCHSCEQHSQANDNNHAPSLLDPCDVCEPASSPARSLLRVASLYPALPMARLLAGRSPLVPQPAHRITWAIPPDD